MVSIVLVKPSFGGNVGAVARAMKNFGFKELILVSPKCDHLSKEAMDRASHAKDILQGARKMSFDDVTEEFDYVVGTTSKIGTDYNIPRCPMDPEELAEKLKRIKGDIKTAIIFGNESCGLMNAEICRCDFIVSIPTSKDYPAMNLSHSVAIILHSLYAASGADKTKESIRPITGKEKKQIDKMIGRILGRMEFDTKERKETQQKLWKRIVGKSMMTRREAYAMMGFLKKIEDGKIK